MKRGIVALAVGALIAFWAVPAFAKGPKPPKPPPEDLIECRTTDDDLCVERSEKEIGATTIEWTSSFANFDYDLDNPSTTIRVNWDVLDGAATYKDFVERHFTPRSKKDPAEGELTAVTPICIPATDTACADVPSPDGPLPDANAVAVDVTFEFTCLHYDKTRGFDIGNAHFKLVLNIDKVSGEPLETVAGYGVNVHVEDQNPNLTIVCPPQ